MSVMPDAWGMGRSPNPVEFLERCAVMRLRDRFTARGLTLSELSKQSGVGRSRLGELLNGHASCTVTDFERLCAVAGERPSRILEEAEVYSEALHSDRPAGEILETWLLARPDEEPADLVVSDTERELDDAASDTTTAALGLRESRRLRSEREGLPPLWELAASRGHRTTDAVEETTGWREDLGEEPQVGPVED